ncbi:MAG TPA: ABC transporter substrate-binding protein [Dehalococcoidia bacterium]|nr:ABC transporter substrate-binding protein [Dehalococcoidia bacterium]
MASSEYWNRFWRRRMSRRGLLKGTAVGASGLVVAGVVGCGDDDDDDDTNGGSPTDTGGAPSATATASTGPVMGGTVRAPLVGTSTGTPPSLDAQRQTTFLAQIPAAYHYNRLLKAVPPTPEMIDGVPSVPIDFSTIEGDAADGLPEVTDGQTFVFTLREGMKFHDVAPVSGRDVTVDDVLHSLEVFAAESPNRGNWLSQVESVEATGERQISITLRQPFAPAFQVLFANNDGGPWIVPPEVLDDPTAASTKPIGAGPWIFESMAADESIIWVKNPDYYDAPKPYIDRIEASLSGDPEVILQNLKEGNYDSALWTASLWDRARDELPDAQFFTGPEHVWGGAFFNFANPPFNDVRVRQAFSMAVDRQGTLAVIDQPGAVGGGAGLTHVSQYRGFYIDPINDEATFGETAKYFKQDVQAARDLLGEAGYPNGIDLVAVTSNVYGPGFGALMETLGGSAEEGGFRITNYDYQEYGGYISTTFFGALEPNQFGLAPLMGSPMDPHNIFFTIFHPSSARHNYGPQRDPHAIPAADLPVAGDPSPAGDAALLAAWSDQASTLDNDERTEKIHEIQRMMAESMYFVPWTGSSTAYIFNPWVKNINLVRGYAYGAEVAPNIWIDKS